MREAKTFGDFAATWLKDYRMEESTRAMRESVLNRDVLPSFRNRLLPEITAEDLRTLCDKINDRGAPAPAVHTRDVVAQIFRYAIARGQKVENPGDGVSAASIAVFAARERSLAPQEIRVFFEQLELVSTLPTIRLALRLVLLTLVRKSELLNAEWHEVDFVAARERDEFSQFVATDGAIFQVFQIVHGMSSAHLLSTWVIERGWFSD